MRDAPEVEAEAEEGGERVRASPASPQPKSATRELAGREDRSELEMTERGLTGQFEACERNPEWYCKRRFESVLATNLLSLAEDSHHRKRLLPSSSSMHLDLKSYRGSR